MELSNLLIPSLIAILMAISVHEFFHALLADRLGDPTPSHQGRLTLNPLAHLDPLGTILIIFTLISGFGIGWGKPVQFNPWNLRHPIRDAALISLAGPASNFIQALLFSLIYRNVAGPLQDFFLPFIVINLSLGIFNLIPIAPLDGFKIVTALLPKELSFQWQSLERYGFILLIFLIFPFFGDSIMGSFIRPVIIYFFSLFTGLPVR